MRTITIPALALALASHAQSPYQAMRGMIGLAEPCSRTAPAWCKNPDGSVMAYFDPTALGIHDALEEWGKARAHLTESKAQPKRLALDAHLPEYVKSLTDYSNLSTALRVGSAWVKTTDEFSDANGSLRLVLDMTEKGCIILVKKP